MIVCQCFIVTILLFWSLANASSRPQKRKSSPSPPLAKKIKLSNTSDIVTAPVAPVASTSTGATPVPAQVSNVSVKHRKTYPSDLDTMVKEFCEDKENKEFIECLLQSPPGAPGGRRFATEARENGVVIKAKLKPSPKVKISIGFPHLRREQEQRAMKEGILVDIKYQPDVDWEKMRQRNEREADNMDILAHMLMGPAPITLTTVLGERLLGDFLIAAQFREVTPTSVVTRAMEIHSFRPGPFIGILKLQAALLQHVDELHENRLHSCNAQLKNFRFAGPIPESLSRAGFGPKPTAIHPYTIVLINPDTLQKIEGPGDIPCLFGSSQRVDTFLVNLAGDKDLVEKARIHGYERGFLYIKEVFSELERHINTNVHMTADTEKRHNKAIQKILFKAIEEAKALIT